MGETVATPRQQAALRNGQKDVMNLVQGNFIAGIQEAARQGMLQSRQLKTLAEAFRAELIPAGRRRAAFEEMGRNAQLSVQQAYTHRRGRRNIRDAAYRNRPDRFANGALLRAIQNRNFYQATSDGLRFINRRILDQEAQHWRRLNFGAGGAAGESPRRFNFEMLAQASFGLAPDPRPAFVIPPGFWIRSGERVRAGGPPAAFFPRGGAAGVGARGRPSPLRMTRGIRATNFLDAGIRRIANDLGPTMIGLYRDFYHDTSARTRYEETYRVTAPRPRAMRFRTQR